MLKKSLTSWFIGVIAICLSLQDFLIGVPRVVCVCTAIIAGVLLGATWSRTLLPDGKNYNDTCSKTAAIEIALSALDRRAQSDHVLLTPEQLTDALIGWGRSDVLSRAFATRLTELGAFQREGGDPGTVGQITVERALQAFDDFVEDGATACPAGVVVDGALAFDLEGCSIAEEPLFVGIPDKHVEASEALNLKRQPSSAMASAALIT